MAINTVGKDKYISPDSWAVTFDMAGMVAESSLEDVEEGGEWVWEEPA